LRVLTSLYIVGRRGSGPPSCRPKNRVVPVPALRAGNKAQARHYLRAVPGTSMMGSCSGRARAVLFSAVLVPAQRAWSIWPTMCVFPQNN
jgi:hypothetical protein